MWKGYFALFVLLLALISAQGRRHYGHHNWRRHQRDREQHERREPTREVHRGRSNEHSRRHQVPHWLSRLHSLLGPNICPRETEEMSNATDAGQEIRRHYTTRMQFCDESETAYRCKTIEENDQGKREITVIYECCHGFTRQKEAFGCPDEERLVSLIETAQELGLRDFVKSIKTLHLVRQVQGGNFTMFAPIDGAFDLNNHLMKPEQDNEILLMDSPRNLIVSETAMERRVQEMQGVLLGHMVPGLHRSSVLQDEQILETESPQGSTIRINYFEGPEKLMTVNCMRVVSRDHMAKNGVIHSVEQAIKPVTNSLMDFLRSRPELSNMKTILEKTLHVDELDEEGKLTLLAPTDRAFMKMNKKLRERLLQGDPKCLERILRNHLLPNVICSSAIQGNARTPNLMRRYINITRNKEDTLFIESAQVLEKDVMGTNGVMHVIDEVLIPDEAFDILQVLEKNGFTELLKLVETAGLTETLASIRNVTLFAPNNKAIEALSDAQKSRLSSDPDLLKKILLFHVSPGENNCHHFYDNKIIPSSEGRQIRLNRYTNFMYPQFSVGTAQCAPVTGQGLIACNGKIKVVSKVMMPPTGNIIDVLAQDKRFSTFLSMVKKAGLADKLQESGPYTVFAPNNEAFDRADRRTLDSMSQNTDRLLRLLQGHVNDGFLCCARINRGWIFSFPRMHTLSGTSLRMTRDVSGRPKVGNAHVVKCDRTATNGNILELDKVLLNEQPRRRHDDRWRYWRHRRTY